MLAAVILDFDGLMMDTESTMLASWQYEWRQHGLELDQRTFWVDHGDDVTAERYALLAAAVGPSYDQAASHTRRIAYRDKLHQELDLFPGIDAWVREGGAAGLALAIASSSPVRWVKDHLRRVGRLADFPVLACGDEVAAPKPAPDVYLLALQRLGLAASAAVAVEDSAHGVAAAKAAGLACIAILGRYADPPRFAAAGLVLASAAQLTLSQALARIAGVGPG